MAKLAVAGFLVALTLTPGAAMSQSESRVGAPPMPPMAMPAPPMVQPMPPMPPMPPRGAPPVVMPGQPAPMAATAYRPPHYGYTLPPQWLSAPYFIPNYDVYRLPRPAAGFGWSRYFNDAVLTDSYGRVYDWRSNLDWNRDARWGSEDYSDSYGYRDDPRNQGARRGRKQGLVGALIGGVVGGIAGNLIGGVGNRLAGSLIGGGVGALAGQAIDKSTSRRGGDWDRGYWDRGGGPSRPHWYGTMSGAPYGSGYGYGWMEGPSVTTVTVTQGAPVMTKTVRYVTEYVTVPAHRTKYVKRAKYVPRCGC